MKPKTYDYKDLETLPVGTLCRALVPTTRWSDDTNRWVSVDTGDVGIIVECRTLKKTFGSVYLVLMFKKRATIHVNHSSIHRRKEWEILK